MTVTRPTLESVLYDPFPNAKVIGFDIETTGLSIFDDHVAAISVSDGTCGVVFDVRKFTDGDEVAAWLEQLLSRELVVGTNLYFDLAFCKQYYGVEYPPSIFDTQIAEQLLTAGLDTEEDETGEVISLSRSLQAQAQRRLGITLSKDHDVRTGFQLDNEWSEEQIRYAAEDSRVLLDIMRVQQPLLEQEGLTRIFNVEMACVPIFAEMHRRGIKVDVDGLKPLIEEARAKYKAIEADLQELLTPHLYWPKMYAQEWERRKTAEWTERYESAQRRFEDEWIKYRDDPEWKAEVYLRWTQFHIPGATRAINTLDIDGWFAPKVEKGHWQPTGCRRYVKKMIQHWRTLDGNDRPVEKPITIDTPINLNSVQQKGDAIAEYLKQWPGVPPPENFQRRTLVAYSVDCPERVRDELVLPMMEFTKNFKLVSSFGDGLYPLLREGLDGYSLHAGWRQVGTATGRPSSSKPNMLNMPANADFRGKFVAREGKRFIVADFSQIELRILAELSRDPELIRAFVEGIDLHTITARFIYPGVEEFTSKQRTTAKIVNFGIAYGMAGNALRKNLAGWGVHGITKQEADGYLNAWRRKFNKAALWLEKQGMLALKNGYSETPLGRRRYCDTYTQGMPGVLEASIRRQGANMPIQGGNADIQKLAMALLQPELSRLDGSILLNIYDELVAEVPAEHAKEAKEATVAAMTCAAQAVLTAVPVKIDAVISPSWNEKEAVG